MTLIDLITFGIEYTLLPRSIQLKLLLHITNIKPSIFF